MSENIEEPNLREIPHWGIQQFIGGTLAQLVEVDNRYRGWYMQGIWEVHGSLWEAYGDMSEVHGRHIVGSSKHARIWKAVWGFIWEYMGSQGVPYGRHMGNIWGAYGVA